MSEQDDRSFIEGGGRHEEQQDQLVLHQESSQPDHQQPNKQAQLIKKQGDVKLIFIYLLLPLVLVSMAYFNYKIYQRYNTHHALIQTSLQVGREAVQARQDFILSNIQNFTQEYSDKFNAFQGRFSQIVNQLDEMRTESQAKLDQIQLLSIKNAEEFTALSEITRLQGAYAKEIEEYHSGVATDQLTPEDSYFSTGAYHQDYPKIESVIWAFTDDYSSQGQYLRKLYLNNVKYYAYLSDFSLKLINQDNYFYYLSPGMLSKITDIFAKLKKRMTSTERTNLADHFQTIRKTIITISLLQEHGGIAIIDNVAFTQPLTWINQLQTLREFHNNPYFPPQVVAFNNKYYSSNKIQFQTQSPKQEFMFPNIQRFFLAAVKKSPLITEMLDEMIRILENPRSIKGEIEKGKYDMGMLNGQDPYYEFYYIAGHMVIQRKQRQLDQATPQKRLYAVDYYGLYSINAMIGPLKLHTFFSKQPEAFKLVNLLGITRREFQEKIGPVRFMHVFKYYDQANRLMLNIKQGIIKVLNGSFVHQMFFQIPNATKYLYHRIEDFNSGRNLNKRWDNLPKKVWVYDHTDSKDLVCKLMIPIITKLNKGAGLQVRSINKQSVEGFVSPSIVKEVNEVFSKSRFSRESALRDYILLLCLLSSEGGIYFDSSYMLMQDLQWVFKINSMPGEMISNRFGELPEMLMFHTNHMRKLSNFTFDHKLHTRVDNYISYDPTFIAVTEGSQLLDEWIEELLKSLTLSSFELFRKFTECDMAGEFDQRNIQRLPVNLLRCLYLRGLNKLKKEEYVRSHYKLWSIDGDYNIYKLTQNTNYENQDSTKNLYAIKYSQQQAETRLGRFVKLTKFNPDNLRYVNSAYIDREHGSLITHNQSIFAMHFIKRL